VSRLDLVVGPNGAGKSTFVRLILTPAWPIASFVNADAIAARKWPDDPEQHSYEAAAIAAATRSRLIELSRPLIAETVFSHPSKLDLMDEAATAGYYVALHVLMVPEDLAVARVDYRKASGGHGVPVDKIRDLLGQLGACRPPMCGDVHRQPCRRKSRVARLGSGGSPRPLASLTKRRPGVRAPKR
jgi:predicted ABC-type ATPase